MPHAPLTFPSKRSDNDGGCSSFVSRGSVKVSGPQNGGHDAFSSLLSGPGFVVNINDELHRLVLEDEGNDEEKS